MFLRRKFSVLLCLACLSGCVDYDRAIERQVAKEHAAIEAQAATNGSVQ